MSASWNSMPGPFEGWRHLWYEHMLTVVALAVLVMLALASIVEVSETEQAVVLFLGQPVRVINRFQPNVKYGDTGAGLALRLPFVENLVMVDKRVLTVEMDRQEVISSDQLRLNVDAFARFRIIDPVRLVRTAGSTDLVIEQLRPILASVLRQQLGTHTFQSLLTPERSAVMSAIRVGLDKEARAYGVQVLDVRIVSTDLPDGAPLDSAFARMQAARAQEATAIRAQGRKQAQIVEAVAEAQAAQIYAASYGKDPSFFDFYRAMKSYEATFANPANHAATTMVLSPNNAYLHQFEGHSQGK